MVIAWILNALSKSISATFLLSGDARQIWLDLESKYSQVNSAQKFAIERAICTISQSSDTIVYYFARIKQLCDEKDSMRNFPPCSCGLAEAVRKHVDEQRLLRFLMGLNESFFIVRGKRHFCTHCKRTGHKIDRCYKLVGYPQQSRPSASANSVLDNETPASDASVHGLTSYQYSQLIRLLQHSGSSSAFVNLAGPFSEAASSPW